VLAMVNFGSKIHGWAEKKFAAARQAA